MNKSSGSSYSCTQHASIRGLKAGEPSTRGITERRLKAPSSENCAIHASQQTPVEAQTYTVHCTRISLGNASRVWRSAGTLNCGQVA